MKIKTLRRIRLLLGLLSLIGVSTVIYAVSNGMITVATIASVVIMLVCITGIIVTCVVRWKEISGVGATVCQQCGLPTDLCVCDEIKKSIGEKQNGKKS